jgi:hypothetical protein
MGDRPDTCPSGLTNKHWKLTSIFFCCPLLFWDICFPFLLWKKRKTLFSQQGTHPEDVNLDVIPKMST